MDEPTFRSYIKEFNAANYDGMGRYYADDVTLSFPGDITLEGLDGIVAFYGPMHEAVKETLDIRFLVMNERHIAVELDAEFRAINDYDRFPRGPLKAGDVVRILSFVHYDLDEDDRFHRIRVGNYRDLDDGA